MVFRIQVDMKDAPNLVMPFSKTKEVRRPLGYFREIITVTAIEKLNHHLLV